MRKIKPDFHTVLFLIIIVLATLEFSYRGYILHGNYNKTNSIENNKEGYTDHNQFKDSNATKLLPEHVQKELFPLTGLLLYDDDLLTEPINLVSPDFMPLTNPKVSIPVYLGSIQEDDNFVITVVKTRGNYSLNKID